MLIETKYHCEPVLEDRDRLMEVIRKGTAKVNQPVVAVVHDNVVLTLTKPIESAYHVWKIFSRLVRGTLYKR
jgi:hypothetical protein